MRKIITGSHPVDITELVQKYIEDQDIYEFMEKHQLTLNDLKPAIGDLRAFLENKDLYQLTYNDGIELVVKPRVANPGLSFLDEVAFKDNYSLHDYHYRENITKANLITQIMEHPTKGAYICGPNGVGKTFFAVAFANFMYEKNKQKTLYVFWPDFVEKTKRFGNDNVFYINKVKFARSLIIDDLGQESISQWSRDDILHSIISFRMERNLQTIITSNFKVEELQELYSFKAIESKKVRSIVEKIQSLAKVYALEGDNIRRK